MFLTDADSSPHTALMCDVVPPAAYVSLHDHLLMLRVQVTLFAQCHFNTGQSVCDLGHFQQFRRRLIESAAIHMQRRLQNLVKPVPPPYYCGNIVVLFIVLYCIRIAMVSRLTCPVAGTTRLITPRGCRVRRPVYILCYLAVALYHWCAHKFYLHMTMSCGSQQSCRIAHTWHSALYLITVLTIWKASNNLPSQLQILKTFPTKLHSLWPAYPTLRTPLVMTHASPRVAQFTLRFLFTSLTW